ncbi:BTB/POZ domain-containing protein at3g22104 [Phtheirospermum japonicum]|uniref:BTB/POZ domain-containing protein at3g22104 n=1 Tax=Phtheirospermum japonicum TaxID=374723 RepID=A0A830BRQ2_9LAMI|nr:BTB/POZ domain-containing protein at3g22104 [Phtheirospermum japonicum]
MADYSLDLEVDVNGEEVFVVNKRVISSYSGRINKLVAKSKGATGRLKVIFNDFPGGPSNFELVTRFCYNNGKVNINPLNISNLGCAAHYMEMNNQVSKTENLCEQTEKSLENEIRYWTWSELLTALKQCQNLLPGAISIIDSFLDSVIGRIASSCQPSPCPSTVSSSDSYRLSCDTRSCTESFKNGTWWFDDLASFDPELIRMLVKSMVSRNFENGVISRFLFYYQKSRFGSVEKIRTVESVIEMLDSLDIRSVSYRSLFGIMRVSLNMKLSKSCRDKLENMIGLQLDRATLDNLLIPSPVGKSYLYDVNLVLRFLKSFLSRGVCCVPLSRLKKVGSLVDLYLNEVAPDPHLKPLKFLALIRALPDSARDTCDGLYHAVHTGLSEEQKMKVCFGLNYEKLSSEVLNHLARNLTMPSKSAVQALVSQQRKLKSLLQKTNRAAFADSTPVSCETTVTEKEEQGSKQIVLYAKRLNLCDENEKLKAHLQGMQCRVVELENLCRKMQINMTKMMRSRMPSNGSAKSVPKLCS